MYYNYNDEEKRAGGVGGTGGHEERPEDNIDAWRASYEFWREQKYLENEAPDEEYPVYTNSFNQEHTSYEATEVNTGHYVNEQTAESTAPWQKAPEASDAYYDSWHEPVIREDEKNASYSPGTMLRNNYGQNAPVRQEKVKKRGGFLRAVCMILVCALFSAGASYGVLEYRIWNGDFEPNTQVVLGTSANGDTSKERTTQLSVTGSDMLLSEIYAMACEQVVGVRTSGTANVFGQQSATAVAGSGFIISEDGYIMTNYHVVSYAAQYGHDLIVVLYDGTTHSAKIIGYEEDEDVAIIKIEATGLNAVTFGDSDDMLVGERVAAVGNPLGELTYTMTDGIVSALNRDIMVDSTKIINMFQINAAVNSGNSGGPVYNIYGEVIGIVTAKYQSTGVEGLGFAIPINRAIDLSAQLIEVGYVTGKPSMGVEVQNLMSSVIQYYGLVDGACVQKVNEGSCAEKAGIKVGDMITALGDREVISVESLKSAKKIFKAGDTTTVTVYRSGEYLTLTITFDEEASPLATSN